MTPPGSFFASRSADTQPHASIMPAERSIAPRQCRTDGANRCSDEVVQNACSESVVRSFA